MKRLVTLAVAAGIVRLVVGSTERWGTLPHEPSLPMPGDELIPDPAMSATRAVVIDAPAEVAINSMRRIAGGSWHNSDSWFARDEWVDGTVANELTGFRCAAGP